MVGTEDSQRGPRAFCPLDRQGGAGEQERRGCGREEERGAYGAPDYRVHLLADSVAHERPYG